MSNTRSPEELGSPVKFIVINGKQVEPDNYEEFAAEANLFEDASIVTSERTYKARIKCSTILLALGAFKTHPELIKKLNPYTAETQYILFVAMGNEINSLLDLIKTPEHANFFVEQLSLIPWCTLDKNIKSSCTDKEIYLKYYNENKNTSLCVPKLESYGTSILAKTKITSEKDYRAFFDLLNTEGSIAQALSKMPENILYEIAAADLLNPPIGVNNSYFEILFECKALQSWHGMFQVWEAVKRNPTATNLNNERMHDFIKRLSVCAPVETLRLLAYLLKNGELKNSALSPFNGFPIVAGLYQLERLKRFNDEELVYLTILALQSNGNVFLILKLGAFSKIENLLALIAEMKKRGYGHLPKEMKNALLKDQREAFYKLVYFLIEQELKHMRENKAEADMLEPDEVREDVLPHVLPADIDDVDLIQKWISHNPIRNQKLGGMLLARCSGVNVFRDFNHLHRFLETMYEKGGIGFQLNESHFVKTIGQTTVAIQAFTTARKVVVNATMKDLSAESCELIYNIIRSGDMTLQNYIDMFVKMVANSDRIAMKGEFVAFHLIQLLAYIQKNNTPGLDQVDTKPITNHLAALPWAQEVSESTKKIIGLLKSQDLDMPLINDLLASFDVIFTDVNLIYLLFRNLLLTRDVETAVKLVSLSCFDATKISFFERVMAGLKLDKDTKLSMLNTLSLVSEQSTKFDDFSYTEMCSIIGMTVCTAEIDLIKNDRLPLVHALYEFLSRRDVSDDINIHNDGRLFGRAAPASVAGLRGNVTELFKMFKDMVAQDGEHYSATATFILAEETFGFTNLHHIYSSLVLFSRDASLEPGLKVSSDDLNRTIDECAVLIQEYMKSNKMSQMLARQVRMMEKQLQQQNGILQQLLEPKTKARKIPM